jgi:hypothetical protein
MIVKVGLSVALCLFVLSLCFNTLLYAQDSSFLIGIICLLFGMEYPAWYANPFGFLAAFFLLVGKPRWSAIAALIATVLALSAFFIREVERNEAGTVASVIGYGAGIYLWFASICVVLTTSVYSAIEYRNIISGKNADVVIADVADHH